MFVLYTQKYLSLNVNRSYLYIIYCVFYNYADETEELIIPGDKQEMQNFMETTLQTAKLLVEIHLPSISMQFISKHIYELIYNRINNDLLLWEPSAPKPKTTPANLNSRRPDVEDMFSMCRSGIQFGKYLYNLYLKF